jgi:hypothetical protein
MGGSSGRASGAASEVAAKPRQQLQIYETSLPDSKDCWAWCCVFGGMSNGLPRLPGGTHTKTILELSKVASSSWPDGTFLASILHVPSPRKTFYLRLSASLVVLTLGPTAFPRVELGGWAMATESSH